MKMTKQCSGLKQTLLKRWGNHIASELECSEVQSAVRAQTLHDLLSYLSCGIALVAYQQQTGEFRFVKSTLVYYEQLFNKPFSMKNITTTVPLWDIDRNVWRTMRIESLLDWRQIM